MTGTVYLLHFDRPYRHARHYLGWTPRAVSERVADHATGNGARGETGAETPHLRHRNLRGG